MNTLKEILDYGELGRTHEEFHVLVESWAYGQERECWDCDHDAETRETPWFGCKCSSCNGTGTIREPGLVKRLGHEHSAECWSNYNDPTTPTCGQPSVSVLDALREELGVK